MAVGEFAADFSSNSFLDYVKGQVTPQQYDTWFRHVRLEESGHGVKLLVRNSFVRDWVSSYYTNILTEAAHHSFGRDMQITVIVDPDAPAVTEPPATHPPYEGPTSNGSATNGEALELHALDPAMDGLGDAGAAPTATLSPYSDTILHRDYTFENFVVGASNRFAHAAAVAVAESPAKSYNPYFLHGSVGLGKTHLLQAICHQILRSSPNSNILYLSSESFINHFIAALENGDLTSFRHKYRNVDVLLVDDIQLLANKERTQEEFFHTFNTLYNLGHQIVLSSDAPPKDIPTLQERLVSRFKMGLVVEIAAPDFETRVNILKKKARMRSHDLSDEVAHFLAEQVSTNIRELEGSVVRVIGYASLVNRALDLSLAREALSDGASQRTSVVTIHDIISVVTRYFSVKLSDLQSKRRTQSIALPRQICMYLARTNTQLSLEEIGGFFGGRDHTTVLYATDKIKRLIEKDKSQGELIRHLQREVSASSS